MIDFYFFLCSFSNDIALLKLSSPVSITSYVKLASLPSFGEILPHNNLCYLTGYGRTSSQPKFIFFLNLFESQCSSHSPLHCLPTANGGMSTRMMQVVLRSVDHQTCTSSGWWGSTVKTNMICAGGGSQSGCNVSLLEWKILKTKKRSGQRNAYLCTQWTSVYQQLNKSMKFQTSIAATPVQTICPRVNS